MRDLIIGVDAGTSVIKAIAFTTKGNQIAATSLPNSYVTLPGGGVEQDAARTWTDTVETLRRLVAAVPGLAERTAAIAVTGQGDGTWLMDQAGNPVGKGWLWLDARAAAIVEELRARPGDRRRFEITGTGLAACQQGPQLHWMMKNTPDMLAAAATAFHCKDWLYFRLTGERATDASEGTFTFGDFRTRAYDDAVLESLEVTRYRHLLPPMVEGTEHHAPLWAEAAAATGLLGGTPVVLGYVDVMCTGLGAGLYDRENRPGCTIVGSTGMHMRLAGTPADVTLNDDATGYTMPVPGSASCAQMQSNLASTLNIDWLLGLAANLLVSQGVERTPRDLIPLFEQWLAATAPGGPLYHPYISEAGERGPFVDAHARAGFIGLSVRHGFPDLARAVVEGLGYAARDCYTAIGGVPPEVRFSGGAARSSALRKILGAVINASTRTSTREEAGAAGAAMMAAVSIRLYPSMDDCAAEWVTPLLGPVERPDPALAGLYERRYAAYAEARKVLQPIWRAMSSNQGVS
ncbi:FGGY-family carbohydrate kinase [soil metagenome]